MVNLVVTVRRLDIAKENLVELCYIKIKNSTPNSYIYSPWMDKIKVNLILVDEYCNLNLII